MLQTARLTARSLILTLLPRQCLEGDFRYPTLFQVCWHSPVSQHSASSWAELPQNVTNTCWDEAVSPSGSNGCESRVNLLRSTLRCLCLMHPASFNKQNEDQRLLLDKSRLPKGKGTYRVLIAFRGSGEDIIFKLKPRATPGSEPFSVYVAQHPSLQEYRHFLQALFFPPDTSLNKAPGDRQGAKGPPGIQEEQG